jgi:hypothetical protein
MRRLVFTVAATALMAGTVPATALAHDNHGKAHVRAHHNRLHRFGHQRTAPTSTNAADNAGTVQSFTDGVLTLTLNDGSTVKGTVSEATRLECFAPEQSSPRRMDTDRRGGDGPGDRGDDNGPGDDQRGDDQGEDQNEGNNCSTADLTPGAVVHEAELRIDSAGAVWKKVELVS